MDALAFAVHEDQAVVLAVLDQAQLDLLLDAAKTDWRDVEPAIFGTLLERALNPVERHKLGAYYTPRAYVERLARPTVVEPLRKEWNAVQASALALLQEGKQKQAVKDVKDFHRQACRKTAYTPVRDFREFKVGVET